MLSGTTKSYKHSRNFNVSLSVALKLSGKALKIQELISMTSKRCVIIFHKNYMNKKSIKGKDYEFVLIFPRLNFVTLNDNPSSAGLS